MTAPTAVVPDPVAHCPNPDCNPGLPPRPLHAVRGTLTGVECRRCRRRYDLVKDKDTLIWKPPIRRGRKPTVGGSPFGSVLLGEPLTTEIKTAAKALGMTNSDFLRILARMGLREWKAGKRR